MARNKRINLLASLTKGCDTVLDIGTDHGLVLKAAFDAGYIQQAIAADIKEKPLNQAKKNLKKYSVSYHVSDGFKAINEPFDCAIIAGMGSYTMCDILDHAPKCEVTYILQPNDKHNILRSYLASHDFIITDEHVVLDGFYYVVIVAKKGQMTLSDKDTYLGPVLQHKVAAKPYYRRKLKALIDIINKADETKKETLKSLITYLKSVL